MSHVWPEESIGTKQAGDNWFGSSAESLGLMHTIHYIFVAHTPLLFEEFPCSNQILLKHKDRTQNQTNAFIEVLRTLGRSVRVNLTLWLLATEHSVSEVHDRIRAGLMSRGRVEHAGDIFVIEASDFAGSTSDETIAQIRTVCEVESMPQGPPAASRTMPVSISKSEGSVARAAGQSRREQVAEKLGIKPTDAMFWRLPGSYGSGKR